MRYEALGDDRDLDEAIAAGRSCIDGTATTHPSAAQRLSNLGFALRLRYERRGAPSDIDESVTMGEASVAAARDDDPTLPQLRSNLAVVMALNDLGQSCSSKFPTRGAWSA